MHVIAPVSLITSLQLYFPKIKGRNTVRGRIIANTEILTIWHKIKPEAKKKPSRIPVIFINFCFGKNTLLGRTHYHGYIKILDFSIFP